MKDLDISSYSDDNTPYFAGDYIVGDKIDQVISTLQNANASLFKWFPDNQMKANLEKCHLPINESCERETNIADNIIENRKRQKTTGNKD